MVPCCAAVRAPVRHAPALFRGQRRDRARSTRPGLELPAPHELEPAIVIASVLCILLVSLPGLVGSPPEREKVFLDERIETTPELVGILEQGGPRLARVAVPPLGLEGGDHATVVGANRQVTFLVRSHSPHGSRIGALVYVIFEHVFPDDINLAEPRLINEVDERCLEQPVRQTRRDAPIGSHESCLERSILFT